MKSILVVDDEPGVRLSLQAIFDRDYHVLAAASGAEALERFRQHGCDVAIVDLVMPGMSGLEVLAALRRDDPDLPIVVLSALRDVPKVVEAVRLGADHYLTKPFDVSELRLTLDMVLRNAGRRSTLSALQSEISRWYDLHHVVGASPAWCATLDMVRRVAASPDTTVMLYGESGTGKELLARLVHHESPRRTGPLLPIHCAAVPESLLESELFGHEKGSFTGAVERRRGCVELADGGTLFLDEIGEMSPAMQSKLLRFLQDHQFMRVGGREMLQANVRVVAATNRDLLEGTRQGWFREDLYYRLSVVPVTIPPLRERPGDVRLLAEHCLACFSRECRAQMGSVSPTAMGILERYAWPGNVRQLRNVIERAVVLYRDQAELRPEHLPVEVHAAAPVAPVEAQALQLPVSLAEETAKLEQRLIEAAVTAAHGNLSQAAVLLRTTRRILSYKMRRSGKA